MFRWLALSRAMQNDGPGLTERSSINSTAVRESRESRKRGRPSTISWHSVSEFSAVTGDNVGESG